MMHVTVVTVCLNAAATIRETLESVLIAGEPLLEYLLMDGGSTDGTLDIIREYEPRFDGRLRWVSEPDDGLYFAMNKGLTLAQDSFVLFLGADDRIMPNALDEIAAAVGAETDADLIYGDVRVVEPGGTTHLERGCETPGRVGSIPRAMPACHQASMFSLRVYRELGGFDSSFRIAADYEFYLRFFEAGLTSIYVPVVIAEFSLAGLSATRGSDTAEEYRRAWVLHGVSPDAARRRMLRSLVNLRTMGLVRRVSRGSREGAEGQ